MLYRVESQLTWEYVYQKVPRELAKSYAYCEMMGPQGPIQAEGLILGLVLFAPGTTYPQHRHDEIEESYISLAGAWSENDNAFYAPGSLILNRSTQHHRITVGIREPCLLAYAWIGPPGTFVGFRVSVFQVAKTTDLNQLASTVRSKNHQPPTIDTTKEPGTITQGRYHSRFLPQNPTST